MTAMICFPRSVTLHLRPARYLGNQFVCMSFQAFVHDEVLRPLAMVNAWAGATPKSPHPVAPRYSSQLKTFSPPLTSGTDREARRHQGTGVWAR